MTIMTIVGTATISRLAGMAELLDVREQSGIYEILVSKGSAGEDWVPLATEFVQSRLLEVRAGEFLDRSIADELEAEGWLRPSAELPICGARSAERGLQWTRCLLCEGHQGWHRDGDVSWKTGVTVGTPVSVLKHPR